MKNSVLFVALLIATSISAEEISVTVYNSDLGVITESRKLEFEKGINQVPFTDVPSRIDPNSVRFKLVGPDQISILEQNYVYDLVHPNKMYQKYLDKEIELFDMDGKLYTGTLLASSQAGNGTVTLQEKSGRVKIILMQNIAEVSFPSLPEGLITRPTLFWKYSSPVSGARDCEVSYQTTGLNWSAEYVGILDQSETSLDLSGWAAISNNSGKRYNDAVLKLVAGDINRAQQPRGRQPMKMYAADAAMESGFQEKEFFEYHLYTLPRAATLADQEIKQISLFDPATSAVSKKFIYRPDNNADQVEVGLSFTNSTKSGLGKPLPAGRVRIFQSDSDGSLILLGEDNISHTPKDEEVDLKVGYAFDISAEHKLLKQTRVSAQIEDYDYEIELRNHKKENVVVAVEKQLYGSWEISGSNFEYERKNANLVRFDIPVPADGVAVLQFKVRVTRP
ncbi:MAG: DUF4139 domain-containing protein [bacterium]|nr:DUF4139 domain-containing protein [bacterium]